MTMGHYRQALNIMSLSNLCVIPARGGSKRIPHKNIKDFGGRPLIAYSIENALKSGIFTDVIVSTDDQEIADIAKQCGAEVPFMRDAVLSNDFTGTGPVAADAVRRLKEMGREYDAVCSLYATAPLLTDTHLKKAYELFVSQNADYMFSGCEMPFPFQRSFYLKQDQTPVPVMPECIPMRSQDLPKAYQDAGQFYFKSMRYTIWEGMSDKERASSPKPDFIEKMYLMPRYRVIDIDTPEDWEYALVLANAIQTLKMD